MPIPMPLGKTLAVMAVQHATSIRLSKLLLLIVFSRLLTVETASAQDTPDDFNIQLADRALLESLQTHRLSGFWGGGLSSKRSRSDDSWDGSATVGIAFGNIDRSVYVRAAAVITSLTNRFADSGYLSISFSKRGQVLGVPLAATLTLSDLSAWGDASGKDESARIALSTKLVYTNAKGRKFPIIISLGAWSDPNNYPYNREYFLSAGALLTEHFSASASLVDGRTNFGINFRLKGKSGQIIQQGQELFVALTLADAFNTQNYRHVVLSSGVTFPIGF